LANRENAPGNFVLRKEMHNENDKFITIDGAAEERN
jgi:hypothetical protein